MFLLTPSDPVSRLRELAKGNSGWSSFTNAILQFINWWILNGAIVLGWTGFQVSKGSLFCLFSDLPAEKPEILLVSEHEWIASWKWLILDCASPFPLQLASFASLCKECSHPEFSHFLGSLICLSIFLCYSVASSKVQKSFTHHCHHFPFSLAAEQCWWSEPDRSEQLSWHLCQAIINPTMESCLNSRKWLERIS